MICTLPSPSSQYQQQLTQLSSEPSDPQDWATLLERPWFTRVWIYQELMFSRDPWVQVGFIRARWSQLRKGIYSLWGFQQRIEPWNNFQALATERDIFNKASGDVIDFDFPQSLLRILEARRGLGVSDPRDMLFAHLGTLSHIEGSEEARNKGLICVDYGKTVAEVYQDIVRYFVQATGKYVFCKDPYLKY